MKKNRFDIIATINTTKVTSEYILQLIEHGATILRLNGAHIIPENLEACIEFLRATCKGNAKVMVDIPGNKIRTKNIFQPINLKMGESFNLTRENFNFGIFQDYIEAGDILSSTDGQLKLQVKNKRENDITLTALCEGQLQNGKGVHTTERSLGNMPLFSERDMELIGICKKTQVDYVGISFGRTVENIRTTKAIFTGTNIIPIFKIETKEATTVDNLGSFLDEAEIYNIDRGDLASEVGIEKFPEVFYRIVEKANQKGKRLFVATQLFASMYENNLPYLSEVMEFYRLINSNICGIQLSDETAVGKYPIEVLELIERIRNEVK